MKSKAVPTGSRWRRRWTRRPVLCSSGLAAVGGLLALTFVLALVLPARPARGQEGPGRGLGRVMGAVVGPDDQAIAAATIRLRPEGAPDAAAREATTDAEGRFELRNLEPGLWGIEITASGFLRGEGRVRVEAGDAEPLEIALRGLAEVAPRFAESPDTARTWVTHGNDLLAQGRYAAAREEYRKALAILPPSDRPRVLQGIARTHFVEGDAEAAVATLAEALAYDPEDEEIRRLFRALLETLGREGEFDSLLAAAAAAGPPAERATAPTPIELPPIELPPLLPPLGGRTGAYRVSFSEPSPLSRLETYLERSGMAPDALGDHGGRYQLEDETYSIFVPEGDVGDVLDVGAVFDAGAVGAIGGAAEGAELGLFVWVSPTPLGGFRRPEIAEFLAAHRLIWVGAENAGNTRHSRFRTALALDAAHNLARLYPVDAERVYVAGYSGGGRVASSLALAYPEVFRGGFFFFGCDYFEPIRVPDKPGMFWPARVLEPPADALARLKSEHRFVFLTGDKDFNRAETKAIRRRMEADGFAHTLYLQIPDADHYFGVTRPWLERGIEFLDAPR